MWNESEASNDCTRSEVSAAATASRSDVRDLVGPLLAGALALVILGAWTKCRQVQAAEVNPPAQAFLAIR